MTFWVHMHATGTWSWGTDERLTAEVAVLAHKRAQRDVAAVVVREGWSEHSFEITMGRWPFTPSPEQLVAAGRDHTRFWCCLACGTWRAATPWELQRWWSPGMQGANDCCCWKHAPADVVKRWPGRKPPDFDDEADFPKTPVMW